MLPHILAVDDSATMRDVIQETLEPEGYRVTLAENGLLGMAAFNLRKYDLVIVDVSMPVMDGLTMIGEIRKIDSHVPIITLSTESEEGMKQKGREAGADGWIVKPFRPGQFLDIVKQIIESM